MAQMGAILMTGGKAFVPVSLTEIK